MSRGRTYPIAALVMLALDLFWLGVVSPPLYQAHIGPLLRPQPDLFAAALFYALYLVGVNEFAIHARAGASVRDITLRGALFGLIAYATFDLTALAMLRGWSPLVTVVDMAWGTALTATVSGVAARFGRTR